MAHDLSSPEEIEYLKLFKRYGCKICLIWDNTEEIWFRVGFSQLAPTVNSKWSLDSMYTSIGVVIHVLELHSRDRHFELVDTGKTDSSAAMALVNAR